MTHLKAKTIFPKVVPECYKVYIQVTKYPKFDLNEKYARYNIKP